MEDFLKVGVITTSHGVRGEVKVFPTTDDPERFLDLEHVLVDDRAGKKALHIQQVRFFKNLVILKFEEFRSIDDMMPYKGRDLWVERENALELDEDEYYIADLLGMQVYLEDGTLFGELRDVLETGANDVYIVKTKEHGEVLLPAIHECILEVSPEENRMTVHLMKGMLE